MLIAIRSIIGRRGGDGSYADTGVNEDVVGDMDGHCEGDVDVDDGDDVL